MMNQYSLCIKFFLIALCIKTVISIEPIVWGVGDNMFKSSSFINQIPIEHIIQVRIGDFLNINCPIDEYHTIYKVSKEEYEQCRIINNELKHVILRCDKPYEFLKYTLYISKFSPVPGAIEFLPNQNYYFISTSNGSLNGIDNTNGGSCIKNNMRLIIKVLDSSSSNQSQTSQGPSSTLSANKYSTKQTTNPMQKLITNTLSTQSKLISKMFALMSNSNQSTQPQTETQTTQNKFTPTTPTTTFRSSSIGSTLSMLTSATTNTYEHFEPTVTSRNLDSLTKTVDNILLIEPDSLDYNDFLEGSNNANEMGKNVSLKIQTNLNEQSYTSSAQSCFTCSFHCFFHLFCFLIQSKCFTYFLEFI